MFGIIWFVVVLYIVIRCVNNAKKNGQTKPNVPGKPVQPNRPGAYQTTGKWSRPQSQGVQQKPKSPQQPKKPQKKTENSILQKAKANATEKFDVDTLEARGKAVTGRIPSADEIVRDKARDAHIHSEHEAGGHDTELHNQPGIDDFDTYHLIDEVNDLIVKGYSGNLEFVRDFLAEATDMLNRISS